jgi:predicted transcriptional regulator YdeE
MKHCIEKKESFKIIGIEISIYPDKADQDIPELWHKFVAENVIDQIPNKSSFDMIGLYSKYQLAGEKPVGCRDAIGSYAYLIGCKVSSLDDIPVGFTGYELPAAEYAVYTTAGSDFPKSLERVWNTIWSSNLPRTFKHDFEVYGAAFQGPEKTVVTHVGIEPK